jgi:hypothetical protein
MRGLTPKEQKAVRTALRFMRLRVGAWVPVAKALHLASDSLEKIVNGRRAVTAGVALSVAKFADVPFDDLIAGRWLSPRVCPHCGHPPDDFDDEDTVAAEPEPAPRFAVFDGGRANEGLNRTKVKKARRRP